MTSSVRSKSEIEMEISRAMIRFEKEFMGRGPVETRTYILDDLVLVRLKGVLTPAEMQLAREQENQRGRYLIKQVRQELLDRGRPLLQEAIEKIVSRSVKSVHTDISTKTGERIIVFTLNGEIAGNESAA
jgi:uncharacterized protein YbcI